MNWRDQKCQDCDFVVEGFCRRFPPTILEDQGGIYGSEYPRFLVWACAEFKPKPIATEACNACTYHDPFCGPVKDCPKFRDPRGC